MKNLLIASVAAVALLVISSCGGKTQKVPFDDGDSARISQIDPTIYGVCGEATAMNTLQLITDVGDTLSIDISDARDNGKVYGGIHAGDRMAVLPNADKTKAEMVINQMTLLGNWVMPNPLDGSDEVGISIKEGGVVESIDNNGIIYKTWRLNRGQLEIVLVREGGSEDDETYYYDIVSLGPDSLIFKDSEDTFEYGRQKPKASYGSNVELEESSFDDFQM